MRPLELDRRLLRLARTRGHTPSRDRNVALASRTGEHAACWLALGLAGSLRERRRDPVRSRRFRLAAGAVLRAYAANTALKLLVRRARPELPGLPALAATPTGLSFPSAHATTGFAAARRYRRLLPAGPLYALAGALALSRLYLGVHFPSDVAAGAVLGHALGGGPCR